MILPARQSSNLGFTLIELLIVISLIAILTGASLPSFSAYIRNQNLRQAQEQLKSDFRTVQTRALVGAGNDGVYKYWGIKIVGDDAADYYLIKTTGNTQAICDNAVPAGTEISRKLPGDTVIRNGAGNWCFFFSFSSADVNSIKNGSTGSIASFPVALGTPTTPANNCGSISLNSGGLLTKSDLNQSCD